MKLWGQRDTLHLYAVEDWPLVFGAFQGTETSFERSLVKRGGDLEAAPLALGEVEVSGWSAGWGDVCLTVERRGPVCHAEPDAGSSRFAHHRQWLPNVSWAPPSPEDAGPELARRYLSSYGPATQQDLAQWAGVSQKIARRWLTDLSDEVTSIETDDTAMLMLTADIDQLQEGAEDDDHWIRLLGKYDPLLLAYQNKDWIIDPADRAKVWRSGGRVEAVVLIDGHVAGTWRYKRKTRMIDLTIAMFGPPASGSADGLADEVGRIAKHFDLRRGEVAITTEDSP